MQKIEKNEKLILTIRKSIIAYLLNTFSDLFLILLWWWFIYLLWTWIIYWDLKIHLWEFIWLIIFWIFVLSIWFYFWYNTYLFITTHKIEKHHPTYFLWDSKEILWYKEIIKISFSFPNIIAKLLNYWTIEIIAWDSEKNNIIFQQAAKPKEITEHLKELIKNF